MMNKHYQDLDDKGFNISKFDYSWAQKPSLNKLLPNRNSQTIILSKSANDLYKRFQKQYKLMNPIENEDSKQRNEMNGSQNQLNQQIDQINSQRNRIRS